MYGRKILFWLMVPERDSPKSWDIIGTACQQEQKVKDHMSTTNRKQRRKK